MPRITIIKHAKQIAVFNGLHLEEPLTVNQARRQMAEIFGYYPGRGWTGERLREAELLMTREEALTSVTCPIHGCWMNSRCLQCTGEVIKCPHCVSFKFANEKCEICGEE